MLHINYKTFYAILPVRSVRTNELQLRTVHGKLLPREVRSVRTNELQRRQCHKRHRLQRCASCAPTNYNGAIMTEKAKRVGALRAHQRITTGSSFQSYSDEHWCALCAPMNYNGYTKDGGRLVIGALRVHQRITTSDCRNPRTGHTVRLMRTNELQLRRRKHDCRKYRSRCASCAPMNCNSQELGFGDRSPGCAPCAPTNYNLLVRSIESSTSGVRSVRTNELQHVVYEPYHSTVAGALRAHQRITTPPFGGESGRKVRCAPCAPTNYNL